MKIVLSLPILSIFKACLFFSQFSFASEDRKIPCNCGFRVVALQSPWLSNINHPQRCKQLRLSLFSSERTAGVAICNMRNKTERVLRNFLRFTRRCAVARRPFFLHYESFKTASGRRTARYSGVSSSLSPLLSLFCKKKRAHKTKHVRLVKSGAAEFSPHSFFTTT